MLDTVNELMSESLLNAAKIIRWGVDMQSLSALLFWVESMITLVLRKYLNIKSICIDNRLLLPTNVMFLPKRLSILKKDPDQEILTSP